MGHISSRARLLAAFLGCVAAGFGDAPQVISLCGVVDNGAGDIDPLFGVVQVACGGGAGANAWTFTGKAGYAQNDKYRSAVSWEGVFTGKNNYFNFLNFDYLVEGKGSAWSRFDGVVHRHTTSTDPLSGGEHFSKLHTPSTYNGLSPNPTWDAPAGSHPGVALSGYDKTFGIFAAPGNTVVDVFWDAGADPQHLDLTHTGEVVQEAVPEPSSYMAVLAIGFGLLALWRRMHPVH